MAARRERFFIRAPAPAALPLHQGQR